MGQGLGTIPYTSPLRLGPQLAIAYQTDDTNFILQYDRPLDGAGSNLTSNCFTGIANNTGGPNKEFVNSSLGTPTLSVEDPTVLYLEIIPGANTADPPEIVYDDASAVVVGTDGEIAGNTRAVPVTPL